MKFFIVVKKYWWVLSLVLILGGFLFFRDRKADAEMLKEKSYVVVRQNLVDSLNIAGEVDAKEKVTLKFQTSGLLTWVGVKEGDTVKKYQVLATLDKRELQNSMSQLLNTYSKTRNDFEQAQSDNKNWETNGMSDVAREAVKRTLQKEQNDLNNSVLALEAKDLALKFSTLYTPIEGVVTKVEAPTAGQNITPTTATFEVINPKTLYFSALADQTEVIKFKTGQTGIISLDSFPDVDIAATVESISFTPKDGESGTVYEIKIGFVLPSEEMQIKMGMTGDVSFVFKENKNALVVPSGFIKTEDDKSFVMRLENDKKVKVEVVTGEVIDGQVEIISGLNENDLILSN